jgi:hypothetical protein
MAKKKRKRHRNPLAPPVHSAPEAVQRPETFAGPDAPPARPVGAEPPYASEQMPQAAPSVRGPKTRPAPRPSKRRRPGSRSRLRTYMWIALVIVVIVGAFVARSIVNGREVRAFNSVATANGCGKVQTTSDSGGNDHPQNVGAIEYDHSPPTNGAHDGSGTVNAGVYDEPFGDQPGAENSIYKAVHSLEHGGIIVWHDGLKRDELEDLERKYRNESKVILAPYPQLEGDTHVVLTSWARFVECEKPEPAVIDRYIELFRSKRPAPEPNNAI